MQIEKKAVSGIILTLLLLNSLVLAFNVHVAESLTPPATEWSKTYGGTGADWAGSLIQTRDGGYALEGYTYSFGAGSSDSWLIKIDSDGNQVWSGIYGGTSADCTYCVVQTSDGGYALAGNTFSYGAGGGDFWLVKTDSAGNKLWDKTYGGLENEIARSVVQTIDGGYALLGDTASYGAGSNDFWLVKTDSAGNRLWDKTFGGAAEDHAFSVVQTSDGGYALAGSTTSYSTSFGYSDFWLVKTDSAGNKLWDKTYGGTKDELAYSLIQASDGGYALAGYTDSYGAGTFDFWLVKSDSAGNKLWDKTYGGADYELAYSLIQASDGGYALAGETRSYGARTDFWLVKSDSAGNKLWDNTYGGASHEHAQSVVQTSDGGYALAGDTDSYGAGSGDFWLIKIASEQLQPPPTPNLISPSNGATLTSTLTSFSWSSSSGATDYQIEINGPSSKLETVYSTSYTATLSPGPYTWRVRAHNSAGWSEWTPTWSFTVNAPPPLCTLTVSSAHDNPSPSVGRYSYSSGSSVTCSVSSPVTEGTTVWTCTGWTGTGSVPSSGSGTTTTFSITQDSSITWNWQAQALQAPALVTPSDHAILNSLNTQAFAFLWSNPSGAFEYQIEIKGPVHKLETLTKTSYTTNLDMGSYSWWVKAHYSYGWSDWSTPRFFEIHLDTVWDMNKNNYQYELASANSAWSPLGNCYGFSSTAILYFMHYSLDYTSYPLYPLQIPLATSTRDLALPPLDACDKSGNSIATKLNNPSLAIMFHQLWDPNNNVYYNLGAKWQTQISNENQQIDTLVANLRSGKPSILTLGNSTNRFHDVVAYGLSMEDSGKTYRIEVYDPNFPTSLVYADFTPATDSFTYSYASSYKDKIDHFGIDSPNLISDSWTGPWNYPLGWLWNNWLQYQPEGYTIVIARKAVIISSNGLTDYFTDSSSRSDSTKFVCGISGSSGIEEAGMQVYAIPKGLSFKVIDPTYDETTIMVASVSNETGQLVGHGFIANVTAPQSSLNFTIIPSDSGFSISPSNEGMFIDAFFFSATLEDHSVFQVSNLPVDRLQSANFTVTNWGSMNSTEQSPVTMQVSSSNQPSEVSTYQLTNGQQGLPTSPWFSAETTLVLIIISFLAVIVCAIAISYARRRKRKAEKT